MGKMAGSSLREQAIYYYIKKFYPNALNRYDHETVKEIDVFLPDEYVGIEYDGVRWHKSKRTLDTEKNLRAKQAGIKLIRIREYGLDSTKDVFGEIFLSKYRSNLYNTDNLNYIFKQLGEILKDNRLAEYFISEEDYKKALPNIYSKIYDVPVDPSISDMCGIELWDHEYNGELQPVNVPRDKWAFSMLRCKNGRLVELPRYQREYKTDCKEQCENCISHIVCPLLKWCYGDKGEIIECEFVKKQVHNMIEKGISYSSLERNEQLREWLWTKSCLGIDLVKEILALPLDDPKRRQYYSFFGFRTSEKGKGITESCVFVRNEEEKKIIENLTEQLKYVKLEAYIR